MIEFILDMTSFAAPEQYDVYLNGEQVGYLRLRNGHFTCDYPEYGKQRLVNAYINSQSRFEEQERDLMIRTALTAITQQLKLKEKFTYTISTESYDLEWDEGMSF